MDNIETEGNDTANRIVRACDTNMSHHKRTDYLDLAKIPKL